MAARTGVAGAPSFQHAPSAQARLEFVEQFLDGARVANARADGI